MARVLISEILKREIIKKFQKESREIFKQMFSLADHPKKGKMLGGVGGVVIKEIKYKSFRFYFVSDGNKLKCFDKEQLKDLLIRFVRMSDKKHQQGTINEIKKILLNIGIEGFS